MKKYLLGCGAQKAGTTWLAKNLSASPEYWNGGIKEWRFWKYYFNHNSRLTQLHMMEKKLRVASGPKNRFNKKKLEWRISALQYPKTFLQDIVDDYLSKVNVKVLGDMTPGNSTLDKDEYSFIKEYFYERSIIVKPLLIMRDPFERIWSEVRMKIKNHYPDEYSNNEKFVNKQLLDTFQLKAVEKRTKYEHIVKNIENVFDKRDICYVFSEKLFSQKGFDRVANHLGLSSLIVNNRIVWCQHEWDKTGLKVKRYFQSNNG
jgi:hypothetical protein